MELHNIQAGQVWKLQNEHVTWLIRIKERTEESFTLTSCPNNCPYDPNNEMEYSGQQLTRILNQYTWSIKAYADWAVMIFKGEYNGD